MSTTKTAILIGICLLLGGCVPVSGIKDFFALVISLIAAVGAWIGLVQQNHKHSVCQKARDLDNTIETHEQEFHQPQSSNVVDLDTSRKKNTTTIAGRDTDKTVSQMKGRT